MVFCRPRFDFTKQRKNREQRNNFCHLKIGSVFGKDDLHLDLVSVVFPNDCYEALRKLANIGLRNLSKIDPAKEFLFPCSNSPNTHTWMGVMLSSVQARMHLLKIKAYQQPPK